MEINGKYFNRNHRNILLISVTLFVTFALMRFMAMLGPRYVQPLLPISFLLMIAVTFLLLNKYDRKIIGFQPTRSVYYLYGILSGFAGALICYLISVYWLTTQEDSWFVTIRNFYVSNPAFVEGDTAANFLIFTVPAILFSPFGEELFFRGFFHQSLRTNFSGTATTLVDCLGFGIVHLAHHGIDYSNGHFVFNSNSAWLWVALMFLTAFLFVQLRKFSNSIYPSIAAHMTFNLTMNWIIFYVM